MRVSVLVLAGLSSAVAFAPCLPSAGPAHRAALSLRMASTSVGKTAQVPAGERLVTKIDGEDVLVINNKDTVYAISPKCPHLGLPMKSGEISDDGSGPCITCKFHNSKFKLADGKATEWTEGVMGIPGTKMLGTISGMIGGKAYSPATVYDIAVTDGEIFVDTSKTGKSGASTVAAV
ncbi:Rieske [2Fe-2S] iron-sulfur domain-containing protein [Baffinella frigidus]|nr:Rieske [2Fe-2S] iron-sulfur domain-containing protein [Cryptophyta sp. CCMP2293]